MGIELSVFTSTLNRAYIINNLYESLCKQTNQNFEWIIVNDGSTDETEKLVCKWLQEKKIANLIYIPVHNQEGIAMAFNRAIKIARGTLLMKIDDDECLREDAIEIILKLERKISDKRGYAGVSGLKCYPNGKAIGSEWQLRTNYVDATNFERKKYKLYGDKAEAYYVKILKQFGPFPHIDSETYAFEGILWNRIAHSGLKIRWYNEKIIFTDYLPDGETANYFKRCKKNFQAYSIMITEFIHYSEVNILERFVAVAKYFAVGLSKKLNKKILSY